MKKHSYKINKAHKYILALLHNCKSANFNKKGSSSIFSQGISVLSRKIRSLHLNAWWNVMRQTCLSCLQNRYFWTEQRNKAKLNYSRGKHSWKANQKSPWNVCKRLYRLPVETHKLLFSNPKSLSSNRIQLSKKILLRALKSRRIFRSRHSNVAEDFIPEIQMSKKFSLKAL